VAGEPVHPAAVIHLHGRLVFGVAFAPDRLDFGKVPFGTAATRRIRAVFEPGAYLAGRTCLKPASSLPLHVAEEGQPARLPDGRVRVTYKVVAPADIPCGPLSGWLSADGITSEPALSVARAKDRIPVTGAVVGQVAAEPALLVFSAPPPTKTTAGKQNSDAQPGRARWILLVRQGVSRIAAHDEAHKVQSARASWNAAHAEANAPGLDVRIVAPHDAHSPNPRSAGLQPPLLANTGIRPDAMRWVLVVPRPATFEAEVRPTWVQVSLADGERLRIPILWPPAKTASAKAPAVSLTR
jgi:hypothetical protein